VAWFKSSIHKKVFGLKNFLLFHANQMAVLEVKFHDTEKSGDPKVINEPPQCFVQGLFLTAPVHPTETLPHAFLPVHKQSNCL
jgi:hypothetical protein